MPFCNVKGHLLMCKRACFAMQKGTFYKPLCNLLIPWWLQRRFLMIMSWFANNNTLRFVRVFQKPEHIPDRSLKHIRHSLSPDPSPKGEGSKKRDTPLYLRRHNLVFECFNRPALRLKSEQVVCYKILVYKLTSRWIACYKHLFVSRHVGELQAIKHLFTSL